MYTPGGTRRRRVGHSPPPSKTSQGSVTSSFHPNILRVTRSPITIKCSPDCDEEMLPEGVFHKKLSCLFKFYLKLLVLLSFTRNKKSMKVSILGCCPLSSSVMVRRTVGTDPTSPSTSASWSVNSPKWGKFVTFNHKVHRYLCKNILFYRNRKE